MNRIFISYSHKDGADIAELLYERLMGCGYRAWKDDHSLAPGHRFPREMEHYQQVLDIWKSTYPTDYATMKEDLDWQIGEWINIKKQTLV